MSKLHESMNQTSRTANGAVTNYSSLNKCLDFFFLAGASRGKNIEPQFVAALAENRDLALRILLWLRDIREGAGERQTFRNLYNMLGRYHDTTEDEYLAVTYKIPEVGRWDDVLSCAVAYQPNINLMIENGLKLYKDGLCAKWMPRKGKYAKELQKYMGLTPKQYRKLLVELSSTVEQDMCANRWENINYSHVPSGAAARYQKAFYRHDEERYKDYRESLKTGEAKINAGAIFPHDVVKACLNGDPAVAEAQWAALPNYLANNENARILPVVDVSGSMTCGISRNLQAIHVAIALGLYFSERNNGVFKDEFITFSAAPEMVHLIGGLKQRITQMANANWNMHTDFMAVFKLILAQGQKFKLSQEEMPSTILVLSDMEFDEAEVGYTPFAAIREAYSRSGYEMPNLVFWNLNARAGNVPVTVNDRGVALVSGYSPSILKSVLGGKLDPVQVMLDTVMKDRYKL